MNSSIDNRVIQQYHNDEKMMIRLFIHWCKHRQLDPKVIYHEAYPEQSQNQLLQVLLSETDEEILLDISTPTLIALLQSFGNDELAYIVQIHHKSKSF